MSWRGFEELDEAIELALETVRMVAGFEAPAFAARRLQVSLRHPDEYPMNEGRIVSNDGLDLAAGTGGRPSARNRSRDERPPCADLDGEAYLLGPTARIALAGDRLHPLAQALAATGQVDELATNVFRSILARAVELVHAAAEAADLIDGYERPSRPAVDWRPAAGLAAWATEAPRGLLFHRYDVDEAGGIVRTAQIVPPTSQNRAAIEADLAASRHPSSTCRTTRRRDVSSSSFGATTRASPARPTSWICRSTEVPR